MDSCDVEHELVNVLFTEAQIQDRLAEMAVQIADDYAGKDLLVVGVLRGAVMVMADLSRAMPGHLEMDWMAVSSYGSGTKSSGVVRILKDLDTDISGRHVLIVDEIIDTGLTLSWLVNNLSSRRPASVEIATLLRKPMRCRCRWSPSTSDGTSPTSSWWVMGSTIRSVSAICETSPPLPPTSTHRLAGGAALHPA